MRRADMEEATALLRDLTAYDAWSAARPAQATMAAIDSGFGLPPILLKREDAMAVVKTLSARVKDRLYALGVYDLEPDVPAAAPEVPGIFVVRGDEEPPPPPELADAPPPQVCAWSENEVEEWSAGSGRDVL